MEVSARKNWINTQGLIAGSIIRLTLSHLLTDGFSLQAVGGPPSMGAMIAAHPFSSKVLHRLVDAKGWSASLQE